MSKGRQKLNASEVAQQQLEALAQHGDAELYGAVLETCTLILTSPGRAQAMSSAIITAHGTVLRLPVLGHPPYKVFWTSTGPCIEAVFPHP